MKLRAVSIPSVNVHVYDRPYRQKRQVQETRKMAAIKKKVTLP